MTDHAGEWGAPTEAEVLSWVAEAAGHLIGTEIAESIARNVAAHLAARANGQWLVEKCGECGHDRAYHARRTGPCSDEYCRCRAFVSANTEPSRV
jgi:hypothetical protein